MEDITRIFSNAYEKVGFIQGGLYYLESDLVNMQAAQGERERLNRVLCLLSSLRRETESMDKTIEKIEEATFATEIE